MRQICLVIILATAAFAGGAFVNGPALQWAQHRVFRSLGWHEGVIPSIDLKAAADFDQTPNGTSVVTADAEKLDLPTAPVPSLVTDRDEASIRAVSGQSSPSLDQPPSKVGGKNPPETALKQPPGSLPLRLTAKVGAPLDTNIKPAHAPGTALVSSTVPTNARPVSAILNALSEPALPDRPVALSSADTVPTSKAVNEQHNDWDFIMRKMQSLGASRFSVEGQVGGRVVFSCLIPLAGRQAVAQRFEAEGSNPIQAAHVALRRITLWRSAPDTGQQDVSGRE